LSQKKHVKKPNKIVFDLDPPKKGDFKNVKFAASELKKIINQKKLTAFVMATGSRGLHVVVPIKPKHGFDQVRQFARSIAEEIAAHYPKKFTIEVRKNKRRGRVFIDYLRNAYGQTAIAPYSLRAKPGAPIAAPLDWKELGSFNDPQKYKINNIFARLKKKGDPWRGMEGKAKELRI
jgi:bifunctional non-homologous end joining protein LigD